MGPSPTYRAMAETTRPSPRKTPSALLTELSEAVRLRALAAERGDSNREAYYRAETKRIEGALAGRRES